ATVPFHNIGVTNLVPDDVLKGGDVDVINADGFDSDPEKIFDQVRVNPKIPVKAVQDQLQCDLEL
nr:hypothetical protein [Tanacetum cinerariifolium]